MAGYALPLRPHLLLVVAALLALAGFFLTLRRAPPRWCFLIALVAILIAGAAYAVTRSTRCTGDSLSTLLGTDPQILRIRARVDGIPETRRAPGRANQESSRTYAVFDLAVTGVLAEEGWMPVRGRLRAFGEGDASCLQYGDLLDIALRAWKAPPPANPGQFDYAAHLARFGVSGLAHVGIMQSLRPASGAGRWPWMRLVSRLKRRVLNVLDQRLPPRRAAILKCLILGEQQALAADQRRAFRETGTVHFLAISGLHVGIIALFCWWILLLCRVGHRPTALLVLGVVLLYAVMAGFRPSVQRAAVMTAVVCGGFLFQRRPNLANSLALAVIVVLLYQPAQIYSAGFQLSFTAVLGLCMFAGPIERTIFGAKDDLDRLVPPEEREWVKHPARWVLQKALSVSLAAWGATLPLTVQHFGAAAPFAPLLTVLLLPAVWLALVMGLPGVLLAPILGDYVQPLLTTAGFSASVMDRLSALLAQVPGMVVYLPPPGWLCLIAIYAVVVAAAYRHKLRLTRTRLGILGLLVVLAYLGLVWHHRPPRHLCATTLATGSGNCVLVQFPDGKNLLFDAGGAQARVGERVIVPALWALGVRRLDLVVLSHADADHCNGFADVARRIAVGRVAVPRYFVRHAGSRALLEEISSSGADVLTVAAGDRITGFSDADIEVLWPPRNLSLADKLSDNELSVVLRVRTADGSVLLTGDFGKRAATLFLSSLPDMRADVLQVSHHGRPDYAAGIMAAAVSPRVAVIPGGRGAERPSPYAPHSGQLLATDDCGMITVELVRDESPRIRTFLRTRPFEVVR